MNNQSYGFSVGSGLPQAGNETQFGRRKITMSAEKTSAVKAVQSR